MLKNYTLSFPPLSPNMKAIERDFCKWCCNLPSYKFRIGQTKELLAVNKITKEKILSFIAAITVNANAHYPELFDVLQHATDAISYSLREYVVVNRHQLGIRIRATEEDKRFMAMYLIFNLAS